MTTGKKKIPDWLIKITLPVKVKTAVRLGIKSRFGTMGFSTCDTALVLWFSSLANVFVRVMGLVG